MLITIPEGYEYEVRITELTTGKYLRSRIRGVGEDSSEKVVMEYMLSLLQAGHIGNISDVKAEDTK